MHDRGIPILERAIDLNPPNSQAFAALGVGQIMSGDIEKGLGRNGQSGYYAESLRQTAPGCCRDLEYLEHIVNSLATTEFTHGTDTDDVIEPLVIGRSRLKVRGTAKIHLIGADRLASFNTSGQFLVGLE